MPAISEKTSERSPVPQQNWVDLLAHVVTSGRRLQREIDRQAKSAGLSDSQFLLLWLSAQSSDEGSAQTELATQLGLSTAQISSLVEQLRRQGLLESQRAVGDRRKQLWRPTSAGEQTLRHIVRQWNLPASVSSEMLSPTLQDALWKGLAEVNKLASDAADSTPRTLRVVVEKEEAA